MQVQRLVPLSGSFAFELDRVSATLAPSIAARYSLAEAMVESGFPLEAIVLGREIQREEEAWNLRILRIVHPLPHAATLIRTAGDRGLNPFFVAGLIRQESAFDARIRSSAGATGLMQLMPPTAREVAGNLGIEYSLDALRDPETNLRLGTTYLSSMVRRFERAEDVLSAYNAGPGRMGGWRSLPEYGDRDVFIEHIPFTETRDYVRRVQGYARVYAALYGCPDLEPCLGLTYPEIVELNPVLRGLPEMARRLD